MKADLTKTGAGPLAPADYNPNPAFFHGEYGKEDLERSWLALVQKTGLLSDAFTPGQFVFGKEIELGTEIKGLVTLGSDLYFLENITYDPKSEVRPKRFKTYEEMVEAGYSEGSGKDCNQCSRAYMVATLVPVPTDYGTYEHADIWYSPAMFDAKNTSAGVGRTLFTLASRKKELNGELWRINWNINSKKEVNGSTIWWVAILRNQGLWDSKMIEWLQKEVV